MFTLIFSSTCFVAVLLLGWWARSRIRVLQKALQDTRNRLDATQLDVRHLRELGNLVDNAVGIVTFDAEDFAFAANSIFCHTRQLSQEAMLGSQLAEIIGLAPDAVLAIKKNLAAKEVWKGEIACQREDRSQFWAYAVFYPQFTAKGVYEGCMGLVIDMTESKQTQVMLDRTRHLTSLGEMAGSIAHEINNPLAVIAIRAEVMLKRIKVQSLDQQQLSSGLEKILGTSLRISKIIDVMRKLSRIESGSTEPQIESFLNVIREAVDFIDERARRNLVRIEIGSLKPGEPDHVLTLGYGLQQILINLLNNALDALEALPEDERWIHINCVSKPGERVLALSIINSGPCIPNPIADQLMTPFFTTKGVGKGTGLGLSLSSKIAESHGGRLYFDRQAAMTTFVLEIPMSDSGMLEQDSA